MNKPRNAGSKKLAAMKGTAHMKTRKKPTPQALAKLLKAADEARERVSTYSDEKRADLEAQARSQFQHARIHQAVRRS